MYISKHDKIALARIQAKIAKQQSAAMTPAERKARASKAAKARWAKAKEKK